MDLVISNCEQQELEHEGADNMLEVTDPLPVMVFKPWVIFVQESFSSSFRKSRRRPRVSPN
jgi:hypothetical protein